MPLIYGEGTKAFLRLQQEILRVSDDQSLFAWGAPEVFTDIQVFLREFQVSNRHGLFADSPMDFMTKHDIMQTISEVVSHPPVIHGNGVRVQYPVVERGSRSFIILACTTRNTARAYIGVPVEKGDYFYYTRIGPLVLVFPEHWTKAGPKALVVKDPPIETVPPLPASFQILRAPNKSRTRIEDQYVLDDVLCLPHATYHPIEHSISIPPGHRGTHAALFFTFSAAFDKKSQSVDGIFPIRCFAIVLGTSKYPWMVFVPILRDAQADTDFHEVLQHATGLARFCMTKRQLKDKFVRKDTGGFQARSRQFNQLLCVWRIKPSVYRNLELWVSLDIDQINLVDVTIFITIDIYEVDVNGESPTPVFQHSNYVVNKGEPTEKRREYSPNWLTIDELEWFKDRITTKVSFPTTDKFDDY
ncbi:hypothetical protein F5B22DRAFT_650774 [Xylaria bambusicola]|uniref:uncharacterized protein n=1 Tax=Xylaria bambusicola TaxID=326684 RepID=UPI002008DC91|nr:uncharacterized protein F5B22DRAFT_650774 [Xylaria bambusicola]KAI0506384.1 hypothetical protein F5B22DRAFT_650774 [Xylaria bambusicola]